VSAASVCEREHLSESVRVLRQHCILRWAMNKVVCKFMEVFQCFCWTEQNVELAKLVNLLALHAFFFFCVKNWSMYSTLSKYVCCQKFFDDSFTCVESI
jgi:hypothetical protein